MNTGSASDAIAVQWKNLETEARERFGPSALLGYPSQAEGRTGYDRDRLRPVGCVMHAGKKFPVFVRK